MSDVAEVRYLADGGVVASDVFIPGGVTVIGDVVVRGPNGSVRVYGRIDGDLRVEARGSALVHGLVAGDVVNEGGLVGIYGIVGGRVRICGPTFIDPDAEIGARDPDSVATTAV